MRSLLTTLSLVLALATAAPTVARDDGEASPLLQAMTYFRPQSDLTSVSFVDWAQLKRLHGAEGVTSASPLEDRQRFLLEVARNESVPVPLGLDRLTSWPDTWGWDTTDLDWQASYLDQRIVLRFGEHWDVGPFKAALESIGFERDLGGPIEVWLPPGDRMSTDLRLERAGWQIEGPAETHTTAPVTISPDGRTVVIHDFGPRSPRQLRRAARPEPLRIAGTSAVRAAAELRDAVVAHVVGGSMIFCAWPGEEDPFAGDPEIGAIVEGLRRYQARADGYLRETVDAPPIVRYVFSYRRPRQAQADLDGRSALVESEEAWRAPAVRPTLLDARVEGKVLVLDVQPEYRHPGPYGGWRVVWAPFTMCGPA